MKTLWRSLLDEDPVKYWSYRLTDNVLASYCIVWNQFWFAHLCSCDMHTVACVLFTLWPCVLFTHYFVCWAHATLCAEHTLPCVLSTRYLVCSTHKKGCAGHKLWSVCIQHFLECKIGCKKSTRIFVCWAHSCFYSACTTSTTMHYLSYHALPLLPCTIPLLLIPCSTRELAMPNL
jgi:hypothetical protein